MQTIRRVRPEELDRVWEMWQEIQDQQVYYPTPPDYPREKIMDKWINLENPVFVAPTDEGFLAGAYILRPNQPGYGAHICNAAYMVDTRFRGRGIGQLLCAHSITQARMEGYRGMQFNLVVSTNHSAMRVWESNGFELIGRVPGGFYHSLRREYVDGLIYFRQLV